MSANRLPPPSALVRAVDALGPDGRPLPHEGAWLRTDVALAFGRADADFHRSTGSRLYLASAGRSPENDRALAGFVGAHAWGSAVDVSYRAVLLALGLVTSAERDGLSDADLMSRFRKLAEVVDPYLVRVGLHPLGRTRWPDASVPQKGDWQHAQTDDYRGLRQTGPQVGSKDDLLRDVWAPPAEDVLRARYPLVFERERELLAA